MSVTLPSPSDPPPAPDAHEPIAQTPPVGWFDLQRSAELRDDDPYPLFNRVREQAPVHQTPDGVYRVMRHADVTRVLRDLAVGVRTTTGELPGIDESTMPRRFMLMQDPPNHTRLRRIVSRAFTPPAIAALEPHVQALVTQMLDAVQARGDGLIDVIEDLARPLPSTVICEMLGVPLSDRPKFTDWTAHVTHLLAPRQMTERTRKLALDAALGLNDYMTALIAERRGKPGDDMLSVLIRAEEDGDKLSEEELITQSIGLLVAGFETTIGLIGNGVRQLMLHPDQLALLRQDPSLIDRAVEEFLRFDGPIAATRRVLHQNAVVGGYLIPKDSEVMLFLAAAARDPRVIDRPDTLDITRDRKSHLSFGGGIHFCLGAHLARMETRVAIGELVRRFDHLSLVRETPEWGESLFRIQARLLLHTRPSH